jgi:hypothetical protein
MESRENVLEANHGMAALPHASNRAVQSLDGVGALISTRLALARGYSGDH